MVSERMPLWLRRSAALLALAPVPAAAADLQSWNMFLLQGPVKGDVIIWTEVQPRFVDNVGRFGQILFRQGVGVRLNNDVELTLGYHWQKNRSSPDRTLRENRIWQQVAMPVFNADNGTAITSQFRLEQRMIRDADNTVWRVRGQVRMHLPLHGKGTVGPVLWSETFFNFNSADWGARPGFEQQRTFAGVYVPLAKGAGMEFGYMNQRVARVGPDVVNHVVGLKLYRKFGGRPAPSAVPQAALIEAGYDGDVAGDALASGFPDQP
jgi:hypothetical protein